MNIEDPLYSNIPEIKIGRLYELKPELRRSGMLLIYKNNEGEYLYADSDTLPFETGDLVLPVEDLPGPYQICLYMDRLVVVNKHHIREVRHEET